MRERRDRPASNADASSYGRPASVPYQTVYHWDRIAVAVVVVLALLAGLVWLGARLLEDDAPGEPATETSSAESAAPEPVPSDPTPVVTSAQRAYEPAPPAAPPEQADFSTPPAESVRPEAAEAAEASVGEAAPGPTASAPAVSAPPAVSQSSPAPVDSNVAAPSPAPAEPVASATRTLPQLANLKVETPSAAVVRAQFAAGVRDNEPAADIATIEPTTSGLIRVYFFTEVKGRKGERLVYRWQRDGNRIATVAAGAWNNAWRSYSSKFIAPTQQGHWRVELIDSRGNVLAAGSFDYTLDEE